MAIVTEIGPAHRREATRIAAMSRSLVEHGLRWRWTPSAVAGAIRHPETVVLAARQGEEVEGFAIMQFRFEARTAHLTLLAVAPRQRRRRLATELVRWLEDVARRGGIETVALEVRARNRGARQFYRALGYDEIGSVPGYYDGREHAVRFTRALAGRS
jgi:ribosomal-protein-alanine N-acetyltransferase